MYVTSLLLFVSILSQCMCVMYSKRTSYIEQKNSLPDVRTIKLIAVFLSLTAIFISLEQSNNTASLAVHEKFTTKDNFVSRINFKVVLGSAALLSLMFTWYPKK